MGLFSTTIVLAQDLDLDLGINGASPAHAPSPRLDKSQVLRVLKSPPRPTLPSSPSTSSLLATSLTRVSCPSSFVENRTQAEQAAIPLPTPLPPMKSDPAPHMRMVQAALALSLAILYFVTKLLEGYYG
ncbi:hypothetical protein TorRG33x02_331210 [Trema orientale]|uniref:Uncharacterized protein n=1 Tax=Trema orientale TaxID=63057 RepID=A0A2P5B674_TREOI|nr:hypothetical protein TorRG33x02_331210 [Trema orientale]